MAELRGKNTSIFGWLAGATGILIDKWRGNWRNHAIAAAVGVFLALVGAFDTLDASLGRRLIFWVSLLVAGSLCGGAIELATSRRPRFAENRYFTWLVLTLLITAPMSILSWSLSGAMFGPTAPSPLIVYAWAALVISGAMTGLIMLVTTPGLATEAGAENATTASIDFLQRLPSELKGAEIYAVSAEDHYLRIHSSKGSALILSRLSDAIRELNGIEGAQTHRSWWVARGAIKDVQRSRGKVQLTLKDETVAPVSRPNVKALRDSGWI